MAAKPVDPEAAAFQAAATAEPLHVDSPTTQSADFPQRQKTLDVQIADIERDADSYGIDLAKPESIFAPLVHAESLFDRVGFGPSMLTARFLVDRLEQQMTERYPLAAAKFYAGEVKRLSRIPVNAPGAEEMQRRAIAAELLVADASLRRAAAEKIRSVAAISALLDETSDSSAPTAIGHDAAKPSAAPLNSAPPPEPRRPAMKNRSGFISICSRPSHEVHETDCNPRVVRHHGLYADSARR